MRVDLLLNNIMTPAGEAPIKTTEDAENGSAGNFFAEIGRALNADESEGKPNEQIRSEQNSEEQDGNDLSLFMSACLFALQPQNHELGLDPSLTDSKGELEQASDAVKADFEEKGKRTDLKSNQDLFDRTIYSLLSEQTPGIQNEETAAVDRKTALNGITLKIENKVPDKLNAAEYIEQGDLALDLQTINASGESMPSEFLKSVEMQAIETSEKTSVQPKLSGKEALLENASNDISNDTMAYQLGFNKLEPVGVNAPSTEPQLRLPEIASYERSIPVDKNNSIRKENSINDVLKDLDPSAISVVKEDNEFLQTDIVNPVSKASEGMASHVKLEETPEPANAKKSVAENSQEKYASVAMGIERSGGTNNAVTAREATTPSQPGELVYELAERIQVLLREGKGEIRIQLKPEHLGNLEIQAESGGNGVIARITAESGSVKNYLENNLHFLQQSLQDQGLKIDRIQVVVQDVAGAQQTSGQSAQFGHAGSGNQKGETFKPIHSTKSGSVNPMEEISIEPVNFISGSRSRFHTVA